MQKQGLKEKAKTFWVVTTERKDDLVETLAVESLTIPAPVVLETTAKKYRIPIKYLTLKKKDFVPLEDAQQEIDKQRAKTTECEKEFARQLEFLVNKQLEKWKQKLQQLLAHLEGIGRFDSNNLLVTMNFVAYKSWKKKFEELLK